MVLGLAVALVLSQSPVKKVEIIRGGTKKAVKTAPTSETSMTGPSQEQLLREQKLQDTSIELDAKSAALEQRADALKAKDDAHEAKKASDAKTQAAQQKILEKHARDLQAEYEKAANGLAGQE
jgi:hypothetical protein